MVTLVNSGIAASPAERRILTDVLVDSVNILPETGHVAVAPPFLVTLQEIGMTRVVNPWCRRADGGFNRSEQHLEWEVCTWEDRKVGRPQSLGGPRSEFKVTRVCGASTVRCSGLRSLAG
jgi:hypothetical protein